MKIKFLIFLALLFGARQFAEIVRAEQLPVKSYTPAEGLVHDRVRSIKRDSRGFLWFGTGDGLSRFDGYTFVNYSSAQGLQEPAINDLIERRDGSYWLATNGGAILFNPSASANETKFTLHQIGDKSKDLKVQTFYEDRAGKLWAGTAQGLFYFDESGGQKEFRKIDPDSDDFTVNQITEDAEGSLWIAASGGLIRRLPDGRSVKYRFSKADAAAAAAVAATAPPPAMSLLFDDKNRLWVGFTGGLLVLKPEPAAAAAAEVKSGQHLISAATQKFLAAKEKITLPEQEGTENWFVPPDSGGGGAGAAGRANLWNLAKLSDGSIWIANRGRGIFAVQNDVLQEYTVEQGLTDNYVNVIDEDSAGNIWIGTESAGAMKITRHGFTAFRESDGMKRRYVLEVFETNEKEIVALTGASEMAYLKDDHFVSLKPSIPPRLFIKPTLGRETPFQDHTGAWWIAAQSGLYHYPRLKSLEWLAKAKPDRVYTNKNGLPNLDFASINEDSRGDIWIGTIGNLILTRWERRTGKFYTYTEADGVPSSRTPTGFAETPNGDVWFSFVEGDILRYRAGKFHLFTEADGVPAGTIPTLFADSAGHLWVPSWRGGVARLNNPAAERLIFQTYIPPNGLSSINARCVTEDKQGRIYVGTIRGVDRLEPESNRIKHYTVADGLSYSEIGNCFRDSKNTLWFATYRGLSKFVPEEIEKVLLSPTLINGLKVAGVSIPVSELGVSEINDLQLEPAQNQLEIDFFSLSFEAGENVRYQYRLAGTNDDWSEPTESRMVNFANLAAGNYRFSVRAIDSSGTSGDTATINFSVLPPVYRRRWFLLLAALFAGGVILTIERYRAARLRELKEAFGKLSVSEQRFRRMIEQSSLGFVIFSPDGSLRSVNHAYEKFWNITFSQIKDWKMLEDEQLKKAGVTEKLQKVFSGENVFIPPVAYDPQKNSAGVVVDASAEPRWIQSFAYPVKSDAGELLEVIMVMEDVTEAKAAEAKLQNARGERLRELEQVRRRIAADLHDDIGSSLTQISIFSEVLQQRVDKNNERVLEPLEFIANSSRELVDAMSDIVWAINPQKDFLSELSGKMHRFAADVFTARNIKLKYSASPGADVALGANLRREVFLIFKESINNIVKHANCGCVEIELTIENSEIRLSLHDDGAGFTVTDINVGHGLASMKQRAAGLGGNLKIVSDRISGTTITLIAPLGTKSTAEKI